MVVKRKKWTLGKTINKVSQKVEKTHIIGKFMRNSFYLSEWEKWEIICLYLSFHSGDIYPS